MLDHARSPDDSALRRMEIDNYLLDLSERCDPSPMRDIVAEHLASGGDRVRARLTHESCRRAGRPDASALSLAACVEALHQASLVHDDLTDRSPVRRGRPAIWAAHGDAVALAAGDHLISLAYACLGDAAHLDMAQSLTLVHRAVSSTIRGQCAGLEHDSGWDTGAEDDILACWTRVAELKSGPLLALGPELAMVSGSDPGAADDIRRSCGRLALGYQILDDCKDRDEDRAASGPISNLCLLLEGRGLTTAEALETALLHAEHELRGAARNAMRVSGGMGEPVARICQDRLRAMEALLHAL